MNIIKKDKEPITLQTANKYCKEDINVIIETEELTITPKEEEQVFEGLYNKVTCEKYNKGVKLFATEEEMQADPNTKIGDFAVVYGEVTEKLTQTAIFTKASFPDTVTLSTAIATSFSAYLNGDTRYRILLNKTSFKLTNYTTSELIVEYTTTDATTYTKVTNVSSYDFGEELQFSGTWKDPFAEFVFVHFNQYGGFFEYGGYVNTDLVQIPLLENVSYDGSKMVAIANGGIEYDLSKINTTVQKVITNEGFSSYTIMGLDLFVINGQLCLGFETYTFSGVDRLANCRMCFDNSYNYMGKICVGGHNATTTNINYKWYILDLENNSYISQGNLLLNKSFLSGTSTVYVYDLPNIEVMPLKYTLDGTYVIMPSVAILSDDITSWATKNVSVTDSLNPTHYKYLPRE